MYLWEASSKRTDKGYVKCNISAAFYTVLQAAVKNSE